MAPVVIDDRVLADIIRRLEGLERDRAARAGYEVSGGGGVTSVSGTPPISSSGGATPAISISAASGAAAGSMSAADYTKLAGIEAGADVTDAGNVGVAIHAATGKTTPVDADEVGLVDSAASNVLKRLTWANLKATAKSYFDTIYAAITHTHAATDVTSGTLADARLSSNVPLKDAVNAFSENTQIGTTTDAGFRLDVESLAAYATARFTRNSTATNTAANVYGVRIKTTADMVNGFGGGFFFQIEDDTAGPNVVATIRAIRDGSDTSGAIVFLVNSAGNEAARLNSDRSLTIAQYLEMTEMTAPAAPAANGGRLFLRDNGSGKTQLCIIFNTGAVQVIAQQP